MQVIFSSGRQQQGSNTSDTTGISSLESYAPWLTNIINEKNSLALTEGLRAIEVFINNFEGFLSG